MKLNVCDRDGDSQQSLEQEVEQGGTRTTFTYQQALQAASSAELPGAAPVYQEVGVEEEEWENDEAPSHVRARQRRQAKRHAERRLRRETLL
jgi:hypothetical protein